MTTEAEFQEQVIQIAQLFRWKVAHFRPARTLSGWRTAVAADGKGFPDLVMARGTRLVCAELKGEKGQLTPEQKEWASVLADAAEHYVWRPQDWDEVTQVLGPERS